MLDKFSLALIGIAISLSASFIGIVYSLVAWFFLNDVAYLYTWLPISGAGLLGSLYAMGRFVQWQN